jgi:hypothetical protein
MVRRGSTVRVRQRASQKPLLTPGFRLLRAPPGEVPGGVSPYFALAAASVASRTTRRGSRGVDAFLVEWSREGISSYDGEATVVTDLYNDVDASFPATGICAALISFGAAGARVT